MTSRAWAPFRACFWMCAWITTASHSHGATIVATPGDSGLRAAIAQAQSGDTVMVTNNVDLVTSITLSKPVIIHGVGVGIRGAFDGELFHIVTNGVVFESLILGGSSQTDGLRVDGEVTLRDCEVLNTRNPIVQTGWYPPGTFVRLDRVNVSGNVGGLSVMRLEATDCTFSFNGGIGVYATEGLYDRCKFEFNRGTGLVVIQATVKNSVFRHNGDLGLWFDPDPGRLVMESCLFYANAGGGILLREEAFATLDNCTFTRHTGNPAIMVTEAHYVLFRHCTVTDNVVTDPGGSPWYPSGSAFAIGWAGHIELQNCLVAENPTSLDPDATGMSGYWIDGGGNVIGGDAHLGVLQQNGGPTMTLLPLLGSPAIDAGELSDLGTDARGLSRLAGEAPDAGATETGASATYDSDGDGLPDTWELFHGLNPAQSADAASDADLDGQSAFAEFRAHTDPNDATSLLRISTTFVNVIDEALNLRYATLWWTPAPGATYRVERSTDLREWHRAPGNTFGGGYGLQYSDLINIPAASYRLHVE